MGIRVARGWEVWAVPSASARAAFGDRSTRRHWLRSQEGSKCPATRWRELAIDSSRDCFGEIDRSDTPPPDRYRAGSYQSSRYAGCVLVAEGGEGKGGVGECGESEAGQPGGPHLVQQLHGLEESGTGQSAALGDAEDAVHPLLVRLGEGLIAVLSY